MNIDDIEKDLGKFSVNREKVMEQLMYLSIDNNALLTTILQNQVEINAKLDTSISIEEHREKLTDIYTKTREGLMIAVMNEITKL